MREPRWVPRLVIEAAAYGYGTATNHPFNDGNKRTALLAMAIFLDLNRLDLDATEALARQAIA